MNYTNDLDGFIKNMRDLEKEASIKDDRGMLMLTSYARKMAEDFKEKVSKNSKLDIMNLRACVDNNNGVFPKQCRQSGVIFYCGTKVTIEEFRKECSRQGYKFKVA